MQTHTVGVRKSAGADCHGMQGWALAAGRLMQSLKPEHLDGPRLAQRFPQLRSLDLSHCLHTVAFHTR